jgi:transaldolase
MPHPLLELQRLGQSPWHDNIRRELLTSGKLARMIADGDITGLTSNPTIFEQAIAQSSDYDADLEALAKRGKSAEEIFDRLSSDDVRAACDAFAGVYEKSGGKDGFCSIEVAPKYARDTGATIAEARRLWTAIARPNLMVKIPATREGVPAIEEAIASGLNINVTLIFSLERYDEVMNAWLRGLIRRAKKDAPIERVASVASFFVSRVDSAVDKLLDEKIARGEGERARLEALRGKAAIANAKLAYEAFRRKLSTEAWAGLAARGAQVQRPLWASTSTKNPAYPDVYYVEALVGPDSVDTMPPATLVAYKDHGSPATRITEGLDEARRVMAELAAVGVDIDAVTKKLEEDGVASFAKSFDALIAVVEERRAKAAASAGAPKVAPRSSGAKKAERRAAPSKPKPAAKRAKAKKAAPAAKKTAKTGKTAAARKAKHAARAVKAKARAATRAKTARKPAAKKRPAKAAARSPHATARAKKTTAKKTASRKRPAKKRTPKVAARARAARIRSRGKKTGAVRKAATKSLRRGPRRGAKRR